MATVWVFAADQGTNVLRSPLVKAEAIIGFTQTFSTVEVLGIHPSQLVTVAASFGNTSALIPDGFHLDLLKFIEEQTSADMPDEHVVIVAEHDFEASSWTWPAYPLSEVTGARSANLPRPGSVERASPIASQPRPLRRTARRAVRTSGRARGLLPQLLRPRASPLRAVGVSGGPLNALRRSPVVPCGGSRPSGLGSVSGRPPRTSSRSFGTGRRRGSAAGSRREGDVLIRRLH